MGLTCNAIWQVMLNKMLREGGEGLFIVTT